MYSQQLPHPLMDSTTVTPHLPPITRGFEQPRQEPSLDVAPLVPEKEPAIPMPEPWYPLLGPPQQTPQNPSHPPIKLPPIRDRTPSPQQSPDPIDQDTPTAPTQLTAIGCGSESHQAPGEELSQSRPKRQHNPNWPSDWAQMDKNARKTWSRANPELNSPRPTPQLPDLTESPTKPDTETWKAMSPGQRKRWFNKCE